MLGRVIEMVATVAFAGLVIGSAAMGRWGIAGQARVFAICGATFLFIKAAVFETLAWLVGELITSADVRGEAPEWGLRLAETGVGLVSGLLFAAGLACLAAALFLRHRVPGNAAG